ncbi:hypothetical protein Q9966_011823 [Columba livia]|nr:hypothetical protein Q9966_011823 [Columba livia]
MPFSKAGAVTFEGHVLAHQDVLMCIAHIVAKQKGHGNIYACTGEGVITMAISECFAHRQMHLRRPLSSKWDQKEGGDSIRIELEDGGKQREMEGRVNFLNRKEGYNLNTHRHEAECIELFSTVSNHKLQYRYQSEGGTRNKSDELGLTGFTGGSNATIFSTYFMLFKKYPAVILNRKLDWKGNPARDCFKGLQNMNGVYLVVVSVCSRFWKAGPEPSQCLQAVRCQQHGLYALCTSIFAGWNDRG